MNKYHVYIDELFSSDDTFYLGSELTDLVEAMFLISRDAAKKNIQRAVAMGVINSTTPLTFGKGQYAYLHKDKYLNKNTFFEIARLHRPSLYRLMSQIDVNGGILSYYEGLKIAGTPLKKSSTKLKGLNKLIEELEAFDFVKIFRDHREVDYIIDPAQFDTVDTLVEIQYSKMVIDSIFMYDIINFLKKQNIIDNSNIIYRNRKTPNRGASHNNFVWDAFAYSKTTGINTINKSNTKSTDRSVLVVLDVVISRIYDQNDLQGFYERIQVVINSTKTTERKLLPIIVYKTMSDESSKKARSLGFITISLGSVFGDRIFEIIAKLESLKFEEMANLAEPGELVVRIGDIIENIKLAGQENNLQNIIGDLFESLMLQLLREVYPNVSISQNVLFPSTHADSDKKFYEYDFIIYKDDETIITETKGYAPKSQIKLGDDKTKNTVNWFFDNTFVSGKKHIGKNSSIPIKACYITSAKFDEAAGKKLIELNKGKLRPNRMNLYYDGNRLLKLVEEMGLKSLLRVLKEHFFK